MKCKISEHRNSQGTLVGWRKFVMGRMFSLGADRNRALQVAEALVERAAELVKSGGQWTQPIVDEVLGAFEAAPIFVQPVVQPVQVVTPVVQPVSNGLTVYRAMELFTESEDARHQTRQISLSTLKGIKWNLAKSKDGISDMSMSSVTSLQMRKWIGYFAQRTVIDREAGLDANGKPITVKISADYAHNVIRVIRSFLDWCDVEGHWVAPHRWEKQFKGLSAKSLQTSLELEESQDFEVVSVRDAQIFWHGSLDRLKAFMGLGLFAGQTQQELSTALLRNFVEVDGELYLDRFRHKTGVRGRWWIPSEVAQYVRPLLEQTRKLGKDKNPNGWAFLNADGTQMVVETGDSRSDYIRRDWEVVLRFAEKYGCEWRSFKSLRKTISQAVRSELGEDYAKLFCAHAPDSVQSQHYTKADPAKLERCVKEVVYPMWKQMFVKPDLAKISKELQLSKQKKAA